MSEIPFFASVGAVNTGKTSTIASLIEDDRLRISATAGETTQCQSFVVKMGGQPIIGFWDTPGFQNAKSVLAKLKALENREGDPLDAFRQFIKENEKDPDYSEECKLFRPIIDGAGILYIIDASQAFREINEAEMSILRMTGRPRMGLINTTSEPKFEAIWESRLGQHFNLVRKFNAHEAGYEDRMELLKALAGIKQDWKPALNSAIEAYRRDWQKRASDSAEIVTELLVYCLQHEETISLADQDNKELRAAELIARFEEKLRQAERSAHHEIVQIFKHTRIDLQESIASFHQEDLFSEDIWRLCGLNEKQLIVAASVAGAVLGLTVDAGLAFHTFGLGALVGGAIGAGGAVVTGKARPKIDVKFPGKLGRLLGRQKVAGSDLKVGPIKELNFPWILLDRALAVFYFSIHRSHARQANNSVDVSQQLSLLKGKGVLTQEWDENLRKQIERLFALIRSGKAKVSDREMLGSTLNSRLQQLVRP